MQVYIVGNITKDVYLSVDSRTEPLEADRSGIKWWQISFDASEHHFFHRISNFGGAAVTNEVLSKLHLTSKITNENQDYFTHRYIFTSDDSASYFTPTAYPSATFIEPTEPVDYLYVDRSANLDDDNVKKIKEYLNTHLDTALVLYLKDFKTNTLDPLIPEASIIFLEIPPHRPHHHTTSLSEQTEKLLSRVPEDRIIYLAEDALTAKNITEPVRRERIDKLTHLSAFSIAAATILGSIILNKPVAESLRLARANLENSTLDASLELQDLEIIAGSSNESLELIAATALNPASDDHSILAPDDLTTSLDLLDFTDADLANAHQDGFRIVSWRLPFDITISENGKTLTPDAEEITAAAKLFADAAKRTQSAGLVPIIYPDVTKSGNHSITKCAEVTGALMKSLVAELKNSDINLRAAIIKFNPVTPGEDNLDSATEEDSVAATNEIRRHYLSNLLTM